MAIAAILHFHLHTQGPPIDYVGLALAAAASWIGVPGPGEPVLIAAGVFAARHKLDITSVLLVAWMGATVGGVLGWTLGLKAGRAVVTAPGPLRAFRLKTVERGEAVFERHPVIAVVLTPAWVAGIHRVRAAVFLPINVVGACLWAVGLGLGAYVIGPTVVDFVDDLGLVAGIIVVAVLIAVATAEIWRRVRRGGRRREALPETDAATQGGEAAEA